MGASDFSLRLVGERYDNEDGSSRQAEIEAAEPGDPVQLEREPANPHDPSAVAVRSKNGVRIGYIGADRSGWIGSKISRGMRIRAMIERVDRIGQAGYLSGVIRINLKGEEPELPPRGDEV